MTTVTSNGEDLDQPAPLEADQPIAPGYMVIGHLHRSRNYDVYDVFSEERGCRCIVKTLIPDLEDEARVARRLVREGKLLLRLTHPHIARAYEIVRTPRLALVLETLLARRWPT